VQDQPNQKNLYPVHFMLAAAPEEEDHQKDREWNAEQPKKDVARGGRFVDSFS
jgi:hypothetical protein